MSSSFKPAFDSSTLYFANQSLQWLKNPPSNIDFENIFFRIRENNIWEGSQESDTLYNKLTQIFLLENGAIINQSGKIDISNFDSDRGSHGHILMQMIFGLLCLSKVIESIVLGEEINYLSHPGAERIKSLEEIASNFVLYEYTDIWKTVNLTDEEKTKYIDWITNISGDETLNKKIEEINIALFSQPYMSFGAALFDVSNGIPHTLTTESTPPTEAFTYAIRPEQLKHLPTNAFLHSQSDLVQVGRTNGYLLNGLFYQYISSLKNIDYVANEYRSPLLDVLAHTCDINDKERILEIVNFIANDVKNSGNSTESWSFEESIDITNLIFAVVVSNSNNANGIIHEAYKMREQLSPLRDKISQYGFSEELKQEIKHLLDYKMNQKQKREFKTKYITIPLQGPLLDFLQKPRYFGAKKHLSSISMLVDKYETMIALTDILSKFYSSSKKTTNPALQIKGKK